MKWIISVAAILALAFFLLPVLPAHAERPDAKIMLPVNGQVITDAQVTIYVGIVEPEKYNIEWVRIYIKGHESHLRGQNADWKSAPDGEWFYYDVFSMPYNATWTLEGLPEQEYTATIWIKIKGEEAYRDYEHVEFSYKPPKETTAIFEPRQISGKAPLSVTFTDLSKGDFSRYLWDFGDGETSSDKNPTYTYNKVGTFVVTLKILDQNGEVLSSETGTVQVTGDVIQNPPPPLPPLKLNIPERLAGVVGQEIPIDISVTQGSPSQIRLTQFDYDGNGGVDTDIPEGLPKSVVHQTFGVFKHRYFINTTDNTTIEGNIEVGTFPDGMSYGLYVTDMGNICGKIKPNSSERFYLPMTGVENSAFLRIWKAESNDDIHFWEMIDPDGRFQGSKNTPVIDLRPYRQGVWEINISSGANVSDGRFWVITKVFERDKIINPVVWVIPDDPDFQIAAVGGNTGSTLSIAVGALSGACSVAPDPEACMNTNEAIEVWTTFATVTSMTALASPAPEVGILGLYAVGSLEIIRATTTQLLLTGTVVHYLIFRDEESLDIASEIYQKNHPYANTAILLMPAVLPQAIAAVPTLKQGFGATVLKLARMRKNNNLVTDEAFKTAPVIASAINESKVYTIEKKLYDAYLELVAEHGGNTGPANTWMFANSIPNMKTNHWTSAEVATDIGNGRGIDVQIYALQVGRRAWDLTNATIKPTSGYTPYTDMDIIFRILRNGKNMYAVADVKSSIAKEANQVLQMSKAREAFRQSSTLRDEFGGSIPEIIGAIYEGATGILKKVHKPVVSAQEDTPEEELRILFHAGSDIPFVDSLSLGLTEEGAKLRFHVSQEQGSSSYLVFKGNELSEFRRILTFEDTQKSWNSWYTFTDGSRPVTGANYFVAVILKDMVVGLSDTMTLELPTEVESLNADIKTEGEGEPRLSAYPNPSNSEITFKIMGLKNRDVFLTLYDIRGAVIRTWIIPASSENQRKLLWDGRNQSGKDVSSGVYILRANFNNFTLTKKAVIIK